jgi:hypothetical protein
MTIVNPTIAILDVYTMESPAQMRLNIPAFASTLIGAVACSAVAMISPLPDKPEIRSTKS